MNSGATIKDVAKSAGVSTTTVFKVLNNQGKISQGVRELVLRKVEELHYVPNQFARALRKSVRIAVVAASYIEDYQRYVYKGIESAFSAYEGTNVAWKTFTYDLENREALLEEIYNEILRDSTFDALILQVSVTNAAHSALLGEMLQGGMVIYCLGYSPEITTQESGAPLSVIRSNAEVIGRMAAQFLSLATPGGKVAILAPDRIDGMHLACIDSFLGSRFSGQPEVVSVCETQFGREPFYEAVHGLFTAHPDITGVYVASYNAPFLCDYLRENPTGTPVTIVGHNLYPDIVRCLRDGSLSATIFQDQEAQGRLAVRRIMQRLGGEEAPAEELITPQLVLLSNLECYRY